MGPEFNEKMQWARYLQMQHDEEQRIKNKIAELENEIEGRKKTIKLLDEKVERQRENLNALNKTLEIRTKENERLIAVKNNQDKEIEAHESENARLSEKIIELKKECKAKSEMIRKAYARYIDEACKSREEIKDECYKELAKDDGYLGFREYTLRALEKTKGDAKEAKEYLCNAADVIIYFKKAQERRKEEESKKELNDKFGVGGIVDEFKEETEVKGNGRTSSGRYPWGAKVNDIPCGEDSIE